MFCRAVLSGFLCIFTFSLQAQTNCWTNSASGNWEDLRWSLGQRPAPGQVVQITNTGWKAIAIGTGTAQNFPDTINPYSITLGGGTNSFNVLLLNFAGFATPLSVTQLVINTNSAVTALSSAINVNNSMAGAFSVGGAFNQGDFSVVSAAYLKIGDIGPGAYYLTNGTLLVTSTQAIGGNFPSRFTQFGGTNYPGNVMLAPGGEYDLSGGNLGTSNLIYRAGGTFKQQGGFVRADKAYLNYGGYFLSSGSFSCSDLEVPGTPFQDQAAAAGFIQTGGSNHTTLLSIGNWRPPFINASSSGEYDLSTGIVVTAETSIGPYGTFYQTGGSHNAGGVSMYGDIVYYYSATAARYHLNGGTLSTSGLEMRIAGFDQTGGTNQVSGDLTLEPYPGYGAWTAYNLSAGLLLTSNTFVGASLQGGFYQTGGTHVVSNLLTVSQGSSTFAGYVLSGGQLTARNIQVDSGAVFQHQGGTLIHTGRITLADGVWFAHTNDQPLGPLLLGQGSNSIISLPSDASNLRFAQSASLSWSNSARLVIEHWNGSVSGSGVHQIRFGVSSAGLSAQQLAQIQFHNPNGGSGVFPAAILSTGEIVPAQYLASRIIGSGLQISWAPGMVLQSATNVSGPFQDVPNASSPYAISPTQAKGFFRLRKTP